jgi:hypothetical protein
MRQETQTQKATLKDALQTLSAPPMTDAEATDAARNLAGFFSLLAKIDRETSERSSDDGSHRG